MTTTTAKMETTLAFVFCVALTTVVAAADVEDKEQIDQLLKKLLRAENAPEEELGEGAVDLGNEVGLERTEESNDAKSAGELFDLDEFAYKQRGPGLTQAQKNRAVELHNQLRRQEGASNMERLFWSDRLGRLAQDWADRCSWGHRPASTLPFDIGFPTVGENLWAWSRAGVNTIPDKPIQDWYDEKPYYDYNGNYCRKPPCGHYTTVTWAETTHVGCGYARCAYLANAGYRGGEYFVCNYGPWGAGERPFLKGPQCTACDRGQFYCTDKLCDSSCTRPDGGTRCVCDADCKCGYKTSDCRCECQRGFIGPRCSEQCRNTDRNCAANPGWPVSWCTDTNVFGGAMLPIVRRKCPLMCGLCQAATEPCRSSRNIEEDINKLDKAEVEFLIKELGGNND